MRIKKLNQFAGFIGLLALSVTIVGSGIRCSSKSSTNNSGGVPSAQPLTISGVLQQGRVVVNLSSYDTGISKAGGALINSSQLSGLSVTPLTGYQLYCVTFTSPSVAGSGTADASGKVTLTFNAKGTPFGCFVLDSSNKGVATLFFSNTTSGQNGQTVSFSDNATLGTITVDLTYGVALVTLPSDGIIVSTTPAGAPCPIGTWAGSYGPSPCPSGGDIIVIALVVQKPSGEYIVNIASNYGGYGCGFGVSYNDIPVAYSGGTFKFSLNNDPDCSTRVETITATIDASCKTMTGAVSEDSCTSCDASGCVGGACGTETCQDPSLTLTRQ